MTCTFILDENVIYAALSCNTTANQLLLQIARNLHKIAIDTNLEQSYWAILRRKRKSPHHPFVQHSLGDLIYGGKVDFVAQPPEPAPPAQLRHQKDIFLVRLYQAVNCKAFIVSSDKDTVADLKKNGFQVLKLQEALRQAKKVAKHQVT